MHLSVSPAFSTRDDAHFKPEIDCPVDYWLTLVSIASSWYEVPSEKEALQSDLERKAEVLGESRGVVSGDRRPARTGTNGRAVQQSQSFDGTEL